MAGTEPSEFGTGEDDAVPIPPRTSMDNSSRRTFTDDSSRRTSIETRTSRTHSSSTRTRDRPRTHASSRELALLLAVEKNKTDTLKLSLDEAKKEIVALRRRLEEAETSLVEVTSRFMRANNERLSALQEAAKANEERELYRVQLVAAQNDIHKAQAFVRTIDEKRVQAERDAAKYKRSTRELREAQLVLAAREEGRRMGFREGLQRARAEVGILDMDEEGYVTPPTRTQLGPPESSNGSEDLYTDDGDELDEDPVPMPQPMPPEPPTRTPSPQSQAPLSQRRGSPTPPSVPSPRPPSRGTGQIHPVVVHNMPLSPRHPPVNIPPDGMIPVDAPSGGIQLPPPHELSPMPPIMEMSPTPSQRIIEEEPRIVPPPGPYRGTMYMRNYNHYPPGQSSPESNSTTISQFDMLNEPHNMMANLSPMSVIEEAASGFTSPNPSFMHGGDLQRNTSVRSATSNRSPTPGQRLRSPRAQQDNLPDVNYQSASVGRRPSMTNMSAKPAKTPPPANVNRPYSPPNIYSNPHYNGSNDYQSRSRSPPGHVRSMPSTSSMGNSTRRAQTPKQRSGTPFAQEQPPAFVPPEYSSHSHESSRKPGRKASVTSAGSSSRTAGTRHATPATQSFGAVYTTLAAPDFNTEINSPQTESSGDINVSIRSPTPPGSARNGNEEGPSRSLNEFLSARDAERPVPLPGSPRSYPENSMQNGGSQPLPTAPFGSTAPSIGTPIVMDGGFFVPSSFTPKPSTGAPLSSSPGRGVPPDLPRGGPSPPEADAMPGGYSFATPGSPSSLNQRPVIPDASLLGPADSDSDSEDRVSSGMNSEANTLTTPPTVARGLPQSRGRGAGGRGTKKKRR